MDFALHPCADIDLEGGSVTCQADCQLDLSACMLPPECGNGRLDPGESCDDGNLNGLDGCSPTCRRAMGTFSHAPSDIQGFSSAGKPLGLAASDIDGDGLTDLVSLSGEDGELRVFFASGAGYFDEAPFSPMDQPCNYGFNVRVRDVDRDGRADILGVCRNPHGLLFIPGAPDASFDTPVLVPTTGFAPDFEDLDIADLNGDGLDDVVAAGNEVHSLWTFWGDADVSPSSGFGFMLASPPSIDATYYGTQIVAVNLDTDGVADVAVTGRGYQVWVYHGDGTSTLGGPPDTYTLTGEFAVALETADLNSDGYPDLIAGHEAGDGHVTVLLNDGAGGFTPTAQSPIFLDESVPVHDSVTGLATGHLNGDTNLDVVASHYGTGKYYILFGDGTGHLTPGPAFDAGPEQMRMPAIGDFDGDGITDFAILATTSKRIIVHLGDSE